MRAWTYPRNLMRHERIKYLVQHPKCIEITCISVYLSAIDRVYTTEGEYVFLEMNPSGQWHGLRKTEYPLRILLLIILRGKLSGI